MLLRLDPPIPVDTPKGEGMAHVLIDYGVDHDLMWVVFLRSGGECWTFRNSQIRAVVNITTGQRQASETTHRGPNP